MTLRDFILTVREWPWQHLQFFRCFEANIVKELFGFWPIAETEKRKEIKNSGWSNVGDYIHLRSQHPHPHQICSWRAVTCHPPLGHPPTSFPLHSFPSDQNHLIVFISIAITSETHLFIVMALELSRFEFGDPICGRGLPVLWPFLAILRAYRAPQWPLLTREMVPMHRPRCRSY